MKQMLYDRIDNRYLTTFAEIDKLSKERRARLFRSKKWQDWLNGDRVCYPNGDIHSARRVIPCSSYTDNENLRIRSASGYTTTMSREKVIENFIWGWWKFTKPCR